MHSVRYSSAGFTPATLERSRRQATLGKRIVGLKVTDLEGNRISFSRATARFLGTFLCDASCGIGYLMAAFSTRKQALHDMIAGTVVVRATNRGDNSIQRMDFTS